MILARDAGYLVPGDCSRITWSLFSASCEPINKTQADQLKTCSGTGETKTSAID